MDGGRREAKHEKVDHKESLDDEEVELLSHGKGAGGTDPWGVDIRDPPEVSDGVDDVWVATVNGSGRGFAQRSVDKHGSPSSGPSSGSGGSYGEKVTAASGGGEPGGLEKLLRLVLSGQQTLGQQARQRPARRSWNDLVCFSCGKAGHGANRCPWMNRWTRGH